MANEIQIVEQQLTAVGPQFEEVLRGTGLDPKRLIRTLVISCERNNKLLECNRQSLMAASMSLACLGLEADGATGQAFLIPFKAKAQPVIGYKGFNTLAGRSGYTINAAVVREEDEFDYQLGTSPGIHHKPSLAHPDARVVASYAVASAVGRTPIVGPPLSIKEILAIKGKSPGARKPDSPWNDEAIGFPAMATKSAIRRLARYMPLNLMVVAAAMDELHEEAGKSTYIDPDDGLVIEGQGKEVLPGAESAQPGDLTEKPGRFEVIGSDGSVWRGENADVWKVKIAMLLEKATSNDQIRAFGERMEPVLVDLEDAGHGQAVATVREGIDIALGRLA